MRKKHMYICTAMVVSLVFSAIAYSFAEKVDEAESDKSYEKAVVYSGESSKYEYVIKEREGKIIVEYGGETVETEISTVNMREHDRELLENGIAVSSYEEVLMLLEDFNS